MGHTYEPLNIARVEFIERLSEQEFIERFKAWRTLASQSEAGARLAVAAYHWYSLPDEAAEHLANAVMKAIADMEDLERVEVISTKSKRPPKDLTERIRRAQARADAALVKDGMEVPV